MFALKALESFLRMEDHAALVMLFWGNVALSVLVLSYVYVADGDPNRAFLKKFAIARIIQGAAWALLISYEAYGSAWLLIHGLLLISGGLYAESDALVFVSSLGRRRKWRSRVFSGVAFALALTAFMVSRLVRHPGVITAFSSLTLLLSLLAYILGPVFLIRDKGSPVRRLVGISALCMYVAAVGWSLGSTNLFPHAEMRIMILRDAFRIALVILALTGGAGVLILSKEEADRRIAELAVRDPLTGLFNRRYFIARGLEGFADCYRNGESVAFVFLDLDGFKAINDRYGHTFGDTVLRDFAALLRLGVRPLDLCCRYGGEEFVVFLPRTGREGAEAVAERLLEAVRTSKFPERMDFSYTVSAGVAHGVPEIPGENAFMTLLSKSDEALYRAKAAGKDRVAYWEDPVKPEKP